MYLQGLLGVEALEKQKRRFQPDHFEGRGHGPEEPLQAVALSDF